MTTYTAIVTDDSVNTCDCCGRTNLKSTVVMQSSDGDILHYGSTCAARNTGKTSKIIKQEIDKELARRVALARAEIAGSAEQVSYNAKLSEATKSGVKPGKEFAEYCKDASTACDGRRKEIAAKYNIDFYSF